MKTNIGIAIRIETKLRSWAGRASWVLAALWVATWSRPAVAYEIYTKLNAQVVAQPVEIVYWVQDGVSPAAEATTIADIDEALGMWDAVPTACISFHHNRVVHSTAKPTKATNELMAVVSSVDSTWGGGALPNTDGTPNYFVVQGRTAHQVPVAAHEAGHSMGFYHSARRLLLGRFSRR